MFLPQTTYNVGESGGPVALTVQTNRPFSVEADDACKDWIIVPDSKAVMKDSVFTVTVSVQSCVGCPYGVCVCDGNRCR